MRLLVEKLSDCKSYAQAVKNSELSESQLRTVRKQFEKLGIQPITLKDKSEIEELKFCSINHETHAFSIELAWGLIIIFEMKSLT